MRNLCNNDPPISHRQLKDFIIIRPGRDLPHAHTVLRRAVQGPGRDAHEFAHVEAWGDCARGALGGLLEEPS